MMIRKYQPTDRKTVGDIAVAVFEPVSIDAAMERIVGDMNGTVWQDRKRRAVLSELDANPEGCFVAEEAGEVVGFITTVCDGWTSTGRIPNLGVSAECQGKGIGKQLLSRALDHFEEQGLRYTRIETTTNNERGARLYPGVGYQEIARQIHYFMPLSDRKDR